MANINFVKRIQDVMRNDAGVNGDAQRIEQIVWILFLKIYDAKEEAWELYDDNYKSIIPEDLKWRNWAVDKKDGQALTGDALLNFINNQLFPTLKNLEIDEETPMNQVILKYAFEDANNYQKDGVLLRQVINIIDEIDFTEYEERHAFGTIYESFLKDLQSAGNAGEFYTPRAVTDFMVEVIKPVLGEKIGDFACGTGGFLVSALNALDKQIGNSLENREIYNNSVYGVEKKALPHILCVTNMLLHDIDNPNIIHGNTLETDYKEYRKMEQFDVILMNPPYGGNEKDSVKANFPIDLRSSETADLFINTIMFRLKKNGRAAVILPDSFLSSTENVKYAIKKKLLSEFNLHTIIRLPNNVFSPYTDLPTNILFFDHTGATKETWFYRLDMPAGYKHFSKTKPIELKHFSNIISWWTDRKEVRDEDTEIYSAQKYLISELMESDFNLNHCGYPTKKSIVLSPDETIRNYLTEKTNLENQLSKSTSALTNYLNGDYSVQIINIKSISDRIIELDSAFNSDMKNAILHAAVQGKLSNQLLTDSSVEESLSKANVKLEEVDPNTDNFYDIPNSWRWVKLARLCSYMQRGKSPEYSNEEKIPVISQKCIQWSGFQIDKARFIDPSSIGSYTKERILQDQDVLINSTGLGTLGRAAIYSVNLNPYEIAVADSHVTVVRLNNDLILPMFLYAYWSNPSVQSIIESQTTGSTKQKELALKTLQGYIIPVPPIEEQYRIIQRLDELLPAFK